MLTFIVSYDLRSTQPDPHSEFLRQAAALGWIPWIVINTGEKQKLPNTTLITVTSSMDAAETSFFDAVRKTRAALNAVVILEKCLIAQHAGTRSLSDVIVR